MSQRADLLTIFATLVQDPELNVIGPLNNVEEARYLVDKLNELSGATKTGEDKKESPEGVVLRNAIYAFWRYADEKADSIPNGERSPEIAYWMGVRNAMHVLGQDGFSITGIIERLWKDRADDLRREQEEENAQEEFLKNRPPAD